MKRIIFSLLVFVGMTVAQQLPDPNFDAKVAHPAYLTTHPHVAIDEAHDNFHTKDGLFKPFADLARNDGYDVVANTAKFTGDALKGIDVLVISNAVGNLSNDNNKSTPAFTKLECDVVYDWVRRGGALFLIADHAPMGDAAAPLAERFGVTLGNGFVFDTNPAHFDREDITELVFSEQNHLLGNHSIIQGRNLEEHLHRLVAFTGESVAIPKGATALLQFSATSAEAPTRTALEPLHLDGAKAKLSREEASKKWPAAGKAMTIAFTVGNGRLFISGEAGMMTAQVF